MGAREGGAWGVLVEGNSTMGSSAATSNLHRPPACQIFIKRTDLAQMDNGQGSVIFISILAKILIDCNI